MDSLFGFAVSYWFAFLVAYVFAAFLFDTGVSGLAGLVLGLIFLIAVIAENWGTFPKLFFVAWSNALIWIYNIGVGCLFGILYGVSLIFVWNQLGPNSDPSMSDFNWSQYIQWVISAITSFLLLVIPISGACLIARPQTIDQPGME